MDTFIEYLEIVLAESHVHGGVPADGDLLGELGEVLELLGRDIARIADVLMAE